MPPDPSDRLAELQALLGIQFNDLSLLQEALTHRSYAAEHGGSTNERLEFVGDSVLSIIVSVHLYRTLTEPEGQLAPLRAGLVNNANLASIARELGLEEYLALGKGELASSRRAGFSSNVLSGCMEALIAAIYFDQGSVAAEQFVERFVLAKLPDLIEEGLGSDPKTRLMEIIVRISGRPPEFRLIGSYGPDHAKHFQVAVVWNGRFIGEGEGRSKKIADHHAAKAGIKTLTEEGLLPPRANRKRGGAEHGSGA